MARAYHVGKMTQIFTRNKQTSVADPSMQALVEMWDDGAMIVDVHPTLAENASKGQYVLVCYDFQTPQLSMNTIIKLLDNETGEDAWKKMRHVHERRKKAMAVAQGMDSQDGMPDARMVR